jgi:hypothetical protein
MSTNPLSFQSARANAALRMADGLLQALGGSAVSLRLPTNVANPGTNGELGLSAPIFQDVALCPAVVRDVSTAKQQRFDLLVSGLAIAQQVEVQNADSADDLFASALGILHGDELLQIESVAADEFAGTPYLYRIVAVNGQPDVQVSP